MVVSAGLEIARRDQERRREMKDAVTSGEGATSDIRIADIAEERLRLLGKGALDRAYGAPVI
jgi:hypothetical protein